MAIRSIPKDNIPYHWPPRPEEDQIFITEHGKARGSKDYEFTEDEYRKLRNKAVGNGMDIDIVEQFDEAFHYMHQVPNWIRKGTFNSICGMGLDASVRSYSKIADAIEQGRLSIELQCRFSRFDRMNG